MKHVGQLSGLTIAVIAVCAAGCGKSATSVEKYGKYTLTNPPAYYDYADAHKCKDLASDALTTLQGVDKLCFIGLWEYNPPSLLQAVEQAGRQGKVAIVAFDENEVTLQGVKNGTIYGTIVQQPYNFGVESVRLMAALARGDRKVLPADGKLYIPHKVIKKDNVDEFHKDLRAKLSNKESGGSSPGADSAQIKVGFVSNNAAQFWTIAEAGTAEAARKYDVEVLFRRPQSGTAAEQKKIIEDLLSNGVKAIAISVNDPKNQRDFLNEVADKVALITQDNDAPDSRRLCYVGTNNYVAGEAAGKLVTEVLPDGGTIAIFVGLPEAINGQERRQGLLDVLAKH